MILNTVQRLTELCVISVTCLLSQNKGERQSLSPFFFLLLVFWDGLGTEISVTIIAWHDTRKTVQHQLEGRVFFSRRETLELGEAFLLCSNFIEEPWNGRGLRW